MTRIAIFASGAGSNAEKIIDHFRDERAAKVVIVVCNKAGAGVTQVAARAGIPLLEINKERFISGDGYLPELKQNNIDFIILAGFLWKMPAGLIETFRGKIINIHPAILPKYGGKGMYGLHVHAAVIAACEKESGITIHWVDEHYDNGDVIFQEKCPVYPGDTPQDLADRIHVLEHKFYPTVIENVIGKTKTSVN